MDEGDGEKGGRWPLVLNIIHGLAAFLVFEELKVAGLLNLWLTFFMPLCWMRWSLAIRLTALLSLCPGWCHL